MTRVRPPVGEDGPGSQPTGAHAVEQNLGRNDPGRDDRLLTTAAELSDEQLREPSLLPGWTRATY